MKIKKSEIVAAVVIVCAVVGIWAFGQVQNRVEADRRHSFEEAHKVRYPKGITIVLDSKEQDQCVDDNGVAYAAGFGWDGRMEATVQEAVYYDDISKVPGLKSVNYHDWQNAKSAVVVKIRLANINAEVPTAKEFNEDPYEFNACIFKLQGSLIDDMAIVGGRGDLELSPTNGYHFVLPPGQTTELEIAYGAEGLNDPNLAVLNIGSDGTAGDKISVDLSVTPAEEGDA